MKILKLNLSRDEDPAGQGRNRANLNKKLKVRLSNAESHVIKLFNSIPRNSKTESNLSLNQDTFTIYDYDLSLFEQNELETQIEAILNRWLVLGDNSNKPLDFYSDDNVEVAYRTGTLETVRDVNHDMEKAAILGGIVGALASLLPRRVDINTILFSPAYIESLSSYKADMFYQIKGLSEKVSSQLYERISSGVKSNKTPREIINDIKGRFGVANSSARRIVNTEINRIYNNSIMNTIDAVNVEGNIKAVGRHKSALLPTTRQSHALRHDKLYSTAQQRKWWDTDSNGTNRINCYCSFEIVLLDKNNKPIA